MSDQIRFWNKEAALPSILVLLGLSLVAQLPHYYYLSDIIELNQAGYISLVIALPIFGAIVLTAASLLVTDFLLSKVRNPDESNMLRYLFRAALITIGIYFIVQFLIIFLGFEVIQPFREGMPKDIVNKVAFKEALGTFLLLLIVFFINPPTKPQKRVI